jgi:hypothetical protein
MPVRVRFAPSAPAFHQIRHSYLEMRVVRDSQGQADRNGNQDAAKLRPSVWLAGDAAHV